MSDIKMCDKCGRGFSVQSSGWTSMGGTQRIRDDKTGRMNERAAEQDQCGPCNGYPEEPGTYLVTNPRTAEKRANPAMAELEATQAEADMWKAKYEAERGSLRPAQDIPNT